MAEKCIRNESRRKEITELCDYPVDAQQSLRVTKQFCDKLDTEIETLEKWKTEYRQEPDKTSLYQHFCVGNEEDLASVETILREKQRLCMIHLGNLNYIKEENDERLEQATHMAAVRGRAGGAVILDVDRMTLSDMEEANLGPDDDYVSVASSSASGGTLLPRDFYDVKQYEIENMKDNVIIEACDQKRYPFRPDRFDYKNDDSNSDSDNGNE
jgi:hypothetical protein